MRTPRLYIAGDDCAPPVEGQKILHLRKGQVSTGGCGLVGVAYRSLGIDIRYIESIGGLVAGPSSEGHVSRVCVQGNRGVDP